MLKFQTPMSNDEVCRAMTDKQTHKQTYWVKTEETFFQPPFFSIFYFHFSNSLNVKKGGFQQTATHVWQSAQNARQAYRQLNMHTGKYIVRQSESIYTPRHADYHTNWQPNRCTSMFIHVDNIGHPRSLPKSVRPFIHTQSRVLGARGAPSASAGVAECFGCG